MAPEPDTEESVTTYSQVTKKGGPRLGPLAALAAVVGLVCLVIFAGGVGNESSSSTQNTLDSAVLEAESTTLLTQPNDAAGQTQRSSTTAAHSSGHSVRDPKPVRPVTVQPPLPNGTDLGLLFLNDTVRASSFLSLQERKRIKLAVNGNFLVGEGSKVALAGANETGNVLLTVDLATDPIGQEQFVVRNEFTYDSVELQNNHASFMDTTAWAKVDYDMSTGRELARSPVPEGLSFQATFGAGTEIRNSEDGGVHARQPDGTFAQVLDGTVLMSDRNALLVRSCADSLTCKNEWYDRETFESKAYPESIEVDILRVVGERWEITPSAVRDIKTGEEIHFDPQLASTAGATSDGRWVAVFINQEKNLVRLYDTEAMESENAVYRIDLGQSYWSDQIVVVDRQS